MAQADFKRPINRPRARRDSVVWVAVISPAGDESTYLFAAYKRAEDFVREQMGRPIRIDREGKNLAATFHYKDQDDSAWIYSARVH